MVGMFSLFWLRENTSAHVDAGRPLDSSMNGGDAEVQDLQLSDSDDEDD